MPNVIKYNVSAETLALKKGNFWIGTGDVGKGTTNITGYWNGITPPTGGYTVYLNRPSGGPIIFCPSNDSELISLTNTISGSSYTTVEQCLSYFSTENDKICLNKDYEPVITDGLVINLDAGFIPSYPRTGTTWYDNSSVGNNGTLVNGPTYGSNGSIVLDGTNDNIYIDFSGNTQNEYTFNIIFNTIGMSSSTSDRRSIFGLQYLNNYTYRQFNLELWGNTVRSYRGNGGNNAEGTDFFQYNTSATVTPNTFTRLSIVLNSTGALYYINGVLSGSITTTVVAPFDKIIIGSRSSTAVNVWNGNCYHFSVYNRALSAYEVSKNYIARIGSNILTDGLRLITSWSNLASLTTRTANSVIAPDGSMSATLFERTSISPNGHAQIRQSLPTIDLQPNTSYNVSFWAKKNLFNSIY